MPRGHFDAYFHYSNKHDPPCMKGRSRRTLPAAAAICPRRRSLGTVSVGRELGDDDDQKMAMIRYAVSPRLSSPSPSASVIVITVISRITLAVKLLQCRSSLPLVWSAGLARPTLRYSRNVGISGSRYVLAVWPLSLP